ncbi:MAG: flagellar basal-body rod protein FlgC [Solirubrobacteraceae bacterium]|jgi:flagellar basal-body rod protein FlgC|nr:flagellar basal-body rod protein FlgC [Solirubrobacteraceae bacterium]
MGIFDSLDISASGLIAERTRMDVTSQNLANAQSTGYKRQDVVLRQAGGGFANVLGQAIGQSTRSGEQRGVEVSEVVTDQAPQRKVYDPGHPDADAQGYVELPNVNAVSEMTDLISASRAYEANVTALNTAKQMFSKTLEILR